MKNLIVLIFLLFCFEMSAKELTFKVTNFTTDNSLGLQKNQFIRVHVNGTDGNYVVGKLEIFDTTTTTISIDYIIKKTQSFTNDVFLFLKINDNYELYRLSFDLKSGKYQLIKGNTNIDLQLVIVIDSTRLDNNNKNAFKNIVVEPDANIAFDYVKSLFGISQKILIFKVKPIEASTTEQSLFDILDSQEDNYLVFNISESTIDFYYYNNIFKKTIKCNYIREDGSITTNNYKIITECQYKKINEKFGLFLKSDSNRFVGYIESSKELNTEIEEIGILHNYNYSKNIVKQQYVKQLEKDTIPPNIVIIEPKTSRDLLVKSKGKSIIVKGTVTDSNKVVFLSINNQTVAYNNGFSKTINLLSDKTNVFIKAVDAFGNSTIKEFEVELPTEEEIETVQVEEFDNIGKYFALIIGVNQYTDKRIPQLDNPIKDAKLLKNVLVQKYTFDNNNIMLLENPNRKEIYRAFLDIKSMLSKNDNLLLFYAGHGFFDKEMDSGYWLPSDSEKDSKAEWISFDDIIHHLRAINSKHTLVISDACFSGGFLKDRSITMTDKAVNDLYQIPSRKVITSGNLTTVPDESIFMKYLVKALNENSDKYMTEENLFDRIKIPVVNNSETTPLIGVLSKTGDEGGNFIFIKK